jgi:hypothetical protein
MNLLVVFLTLTADAAASPQEWGRSFLLFLLEQNRRPD